MKEYRDGNGELDSGEDIPEGPERERKDGHNKDE
jgi:hypothetical protein